MKTEEVPAPDSQKTFNGLLLVMLEYMAENRAYFITLMNELARQNAVKNGTTDKEEKEKLETAYDLNLKGGHARFGAKIKEQLPELGPLMDGYIKDLLGDIEAKPN